MAYAYPSESYYDYSQPAYTQAPSYQLQPHPYEAAYTTHSSHLAPEYNSRHSSPSSAESSSRRRRSSIYRDDPERVVVAASPSRRDRERQDRAQDRLDKERLDQERLDKEERRRRRREEKSKAIPIPIQRSTTMPAGHTITPSYETRGRRPVIMSEYVDANETSARIPIGPVDIVEHASRRSKRYSSSSRYDDRYGSSPKGYASGEEESNRRREQRKSHRVDVRQGPEFSRSAPGPGHHDKLNVEYGTSPSPYASSFASSGSGTPYSSSPANETKSLRWADQERRAQNDRISSRPKLSRADSVKEPKSILKNSANNTAANTPSTSRQSSRKRDSAVDGLAADMADLSMKNDAEYQRLADRFSTRRHSSFGPGAGSRSKTEYWSDGKGKYYY